MEQKGEVRATEGKAAAQNAGLSNTQTSTM